jgi:hypothetical protein
VNHECHVPKDTSDFPEASKFNLEYHILINRAGGIPPSPPESPPHTHRNKFEDNSEEEDGSESEFKDNPYQVIVYQPLNMAKANENRNPPLPTLVVC